MNTVSFCEPSPPAEIPSTAPSTTLNLDRVHGFNSRESRQNLFYTKTGDSIITPPAPSASSSPPQRRREDPAVRQRPHRQDHRLAVHQRPRA